MESIFLWIDHGLKRFFKPFRLRTGRCMFVSTHIVMHTLVVVYFRRCHYDDVIMGEIASQITSLTIVYSAVYLDAAQRKYQSSASLAFVRGIHRGPVNSPLKWPVTRKMFTFDDVIMVNHVHKCKWLDINNSTIETLMIFLLISEIVGHVYVRTSSLNNVGVASYIFEIFDSHGWILAHHKHCIVVSFYQGCIFRYDRTNTMWINVEFIARGYV